MQDVGFPAHAGMDRGGGGRARARSRLPRTRGDGPVTTSVNVDRGGASPHTRGWTPSVARRQRARPGFPAHAGMDPAPGWPRGRTPRLPRTRGDGPDGFALRADEVAASPHTRGWTLPPAAEPLQGRGFPAHAGMDP